MNHVTSPLHISGDVIPVLQFLSGWHHEDPVVLGYLYAVRPSSIRVTTDGVKCDWQDWRVTIWVDDKGIIKGIKQEVRVGLHGGIEHGDDLDYRLRNEKKSKP